MKPAATARKHSPRRWRASVLLLALVASCSAAPARAGLDQGRPACDYCRMILGDPAFGAEITLHSGRRKIYDSIECMAAAVLTDSVEQRDIRAIRLVDHEAPHARVTLARTVFTLCPGTESPMGLSLLAFGSRASAERACPAPVGRLLDWRGVLERVNKVWFQGRLAVEPHVWSPGARPRRVAGPR